MSQGSLSFFIFRAVNDSGIKIVINKIKNRNLAYMEIMNMNFILLQSSIPLVYHRLK